MLDVSAALAGAGSAGCGVTVALVWVFVGSGLD
jgi:hypothetical protein